MGIPGHMEIPDSVFNSSGGISLWGVIGAELYFKVVHRIAKRSSHYEIICDDHDEEVTLCGCVLSRLDGHLLILIAVSRTVDATRGVPGSS